MRAKLVRVGGRVMNVGVGMGHATRMNVCSGVDDVCWSRNVSQSSSRFSDGILSTLSSRCASAGGSLAALILRKWSPRKTASGPMTINSPSACPSGSHNAYSFALVSGACTAVYLNRSRRRCGGKYGTTYSAKSASEKDVNSRRRHSIVSGGAATSSELMLMSIWAEGNRERTVESASMRRATASACVFNWLFLLASNAQLRGIGPATTFVSIKLASIEGVDSFSEYVGGKGQMRFAGRVRELWVCDERRWVRSLRTFCECRNCSPLSKPLSNL